MYSKGIYNSMLLSTIMDIMSAFHLSFCKLCFQQNQQMLKLNLLGSYQPSKLLAQIHASFKNKMKNIRLLLSYN